jgi:hypothetical protein
MYEPKTQELWEIFSFISKKWQSQDGVSLDQFELIINYKVTLNSVYTTYYQNTVLEFQKLLNQFGNKEKALVQLFRENQMPTPKLPDVAKYVLNEFMTMHVAFGGFKVLGYQNYRGWMGGGTYQQTPPPYRVVKKGEF